MITINNRRYFGNKTKLLDFNYKNSNYQRKDDSYTDEILVINYDLD